jgi:hypothetical protein
LSNTATRRADRGHGGAGLASTAVTASLATHE